LFKVFFTVGILVLVCGVTFIMIDWIVHSFTEGLRVVGTRFTIAGIVSIILAYLYRYHKVLGFLLVQFKHKIRNKQDKSSEWHKP
jgi:drug/metabolite transporter (DMT)-like permease